MGLGDFLSSILGGTAGQQQMNQATDLSQQAVDQLKNLAVPTTAEQQVQLSAPELAGLLQAQQVNGTAMSGVSTDPRLQQAQMNALQQLAGLSQQGWSPEDRAAFNQAIRTSEGQASAENASTLQNAAAMGKLGAGDTLLAQLNAGQSAANRTQQAGEQQAAQASQARRDALSQYSSAAQNIANNNFGQKAQIANAKDTINQFNAQNRQNTGQYNLSNQQDIANQKANAANQSKLYNSGLIQQQFQNNLSKATGVAGQQQNLANTYANQGQAAAQGQSQMTGSLLNGAASIGAAAAKKG